MSKLKSILKVSAIMGIFAGMFYAGSVFADSGGSIVTIDQVQSNLSKSYGSLIQTFAGGATVGAIFLLLVAIYLFRQNYMKSQSGQPTLINALLCTTASAALFTVGPVSQLFVSSAMGTQVASNYEKTSGTNFETLVKS